MKNREKKTIAIIAVCVLAVVISVIGVFWFLQRQEETFLRMDFTGDISNMTSKKDVRTIQVSFQHGWQKIDCYATVKPQGTSSLVYDKKNYTIEFYKDETLEEVQKIDFGWGKQSTYCLKANWIDKTHARNVVTAKLAAEIQEKYHLLDNAPNNGLIDGFPLEIYSNGEFLGLYTLNIPKDAWMFAMDENNENHLVFCGEENANPVGVMKELPNYDVWSLEVGQETPESLKKLERLFDFIINSSDEEFKEHFSEYLNLDATLNYIIMSNFALLHDNNAKNMLLATYDGNIWYPSLYDLDTSWGVDYNGRELWDYTPVPTTDVNNLFYRVRENFKKELAERYFALREDILTKEHIMGKFNAFRDKIPAEVFAQENTRWKNIPGFDYTQIEDYLDKRLPILDAYMKTLL